MNIASMRRCPQQRWAASAQSTLNKVGTQLKDGAVDLYEDCQFAADKGLESLEQGLRQARMRAAKAALKGMVKSAWTIVKNL